MTRMTDGIWHIRILWIDEAHFLLIRIINSMNFINWEDSNPHCVVSLSLHEEKKIVMRYNKYLHPKLLLD